MCCANFAIRIYVQEFNPHVIACVSSMYWYTIVARTIFVLPYHPFIIIFIICKTFIELGKYTARFSDSDRSLNRKRERLKVFEVEPGSNRDDVIINLIIN